MQMTSPYQRYVLEGSNGEAELCSILCIRDVALKSLITRMVLYADNFGSTMYLNMHVIILVGKVPVGFKLI